MADIFLSYSSTDRDAVAPLVAHLQSSGYSVWWDRKIQGGSMFSKEIETELKASKIVLVAWSAASIESRWVADEVELALNTGKLVPITIDSTPPPMGFRQIQTIDFAGWQNGGDEACLQTLMAALSHHTGSTPETAAQTVKDASIAVLPFVNMSADPEQEYFSDGLSEELLNLLAKIDKMRVSARTSSFKFKGKDVDIFEVGSALNVAHVLEGSVRKAGNRIRVTAQLIETKDGFHLWSDTYDRDLDDIFAIQDEISAAIVGALKEVVLGDLVAPQTEKTKNVEAYEIYLQAHQEFLKNRSIATIKRGVENLERALELDPDFVPALIEFARFQHLLSNDIGNMGTTPVELAAAKALPYIEKALKLAPDFSDAHTAMASHYLKTRELDKADREIEKALELNPSSTEARTTLLFAKLFRADPRADTISLTREICELDPLNTVSLGNLSTHLVEYGAFDEAAQIVEKMSVLAPGTSEYLFRQGELFDTQSQFANLLQALADNKSAIKGGARVLTYFIGPSALGVGAQFEFLDPRSACLNYLLLADYEGARRCARSIEASPEKHDDYRRDLTLSLVETVSGDIKGAHARLSKHDDKNPDTWGAHFGTEEFLHGAQLTAYLHKMVGDEESAAHFLSKMATAYEIQLQDPSGPRFFTHMLGASVATLEGNTDLALTRVEMHLVQTLVGSIGFKGLPWFDSLRDEPRFQAVIDRIDAHIAEEKQKAEKMGLLPLPEDLTLLLKELKAN